MAKIFKTHNCLDGWLTVSSHLRQNHNKDTNILLEIDDISIDKNWLINYNPANIKSDFDNIRNVVNTIFPYKVDRTRHADLLSYFQYVSKLYKRVSKKNGQWGTYFQRLIEFPSNNGTTSNQLNRIIETLNNWQKDCVACRTIHISSIATDNLNVRGTPCWHYGEFLSDPITRKLSLVAVYRNHDYLNKALGNFIGLSYLLQFICNETGRQPGKLIIHSVHAFCKPAIDQLLPN